MKKINVISCLFAASLLLWAGASADAQSFGNRLGRMVKSTAEREVGKSVNKALDKASKEISEGVKKGVTKATAKTGPAIYVNISRGSARGDGSAQSPYKDIQKAINEAPEGAVIRIAEGNYLGTLDRGWIEIKDKYVNLEGGWNDSFTERNPQKYITRIQPGIAQKGTIGMGLLMINVTKNRYATMCIDGICFDLGLCMEYAPADPNDPRHGCPPGCETGRILPVSTPPNPSIRLIGGSMAGDLTVRNCMFLNGSFYGFIMMHKGGNWDIYNNVFVSNIVASFEAHGGLNQDTDPHVSKVDFHHNTVMFSWTTTKEMESNGYGYRFRNGVDHNVHHNVFGCNNFGALDMGWDDSNLPQSNRKICSAYDNRFFMNKGDLVMAGTSGGNWLYIPGRRFDEVEQLVKYENNAELDQNSGLQDVIIEPYLKGYASLEVIKTESFDPNSAANIFREAHGLNMRGTSTTRVSMYGNRYNFDKALDFFGAVEGYGAQLFAE